MMEARKRREDRKKKAPEVFWMKLKNIPYGVNDLQVKKCLDDRGGSAVVRCVIARDRDNLAAKSFGFVEFRGVEDMQRIRSKRHRLKNQLMKLEACEPPLGKVWRFSEEEKEKLRSQVRSASRCALHALSVLNDAIVDCEHVHARDCDSEHMTEFLGMDTIEILTQMSDKFAKCIESLEMGDIDIVSHLRREISNSLEDSVGSPVSSISTSPTSSPPASPLPSPKMSWAKVVENSVQSSDINALARNFAKYGTPKKNIVYSLVERRLPKSASPISLARPKMNRSTSADIVRRVCSFEDLRSLAAPDALERQVSSKSVMSILSDVSHGSADSDFSADAKVSFAPSMMATRRAKRSHSRTDAEIIRECMRVGRVFKRRRWKLRTMPPNQKQRYTQRDRVTMAKMIWNDNKNRGREKEVVIKFIAGIEKGKNEAYLQSKIMLRYGLRILDFFIIEKRIYAIVMPRVQSLLDKCVRWCGAKQRKKSDVQKVGAYAREMVECLRELHSADFVHNDVKPEHYVFLEDEVRMIDFGSVAREKARASVETTPLYLSPEYKSMLATDGHVICSYENDIFALGLSLFVLFSCQEAPDWNEKQWEKELGSGPYIYDQLTREMRNILKYIILGRENGKRPTCDQIVRKRFFSNAFARDTETQRFCSLLALFSSPTRFQSNAPIPSLRMRRELQGLTSTIADTVVCPAARLDDVARLIRLHSPIAVQFSGHSMSCQSIIGRALLFENKQGVISEVNAPTFIHSVRDGLDGQSKMTVNSRSLSLIFLNACDTLSLARKLVEALPSVSVVCWASDVETNCATFVSRAFYSALSKPMSQTALTSHCVTEAFMVAKEALEESSQYTCGDPRYYRHEDGHEHLKKGAYDPLCTGCKPPVHGIFCLVHAHGEIWCCKNCRMKSKQGGY